MIIPYGTLINAGAVLLGGTVGMLLSKGFPDKIKEIIFQGLGLCTLAIGILMVLKVENVLLMIFSVLIGGILGEVIGLERLFERFGDFLKARLKSDNALFTEGLVTSFLIFCIGSLTIMGSLDEGIRGDMTLVLTKSLLDGFASIALAVTFGSGVLFSVIPLILYQGLLTISASGAQMFFNPFMIAQLTAVGGILVLGIGFNLLAIKKIKATNMLPALLIIVILSWAIQWLPKP